MSKTIELYWDMKGNRMHAADFARRYPTRVNVGLYEILGIEVITEFVGVNHNSDPDGRPWIFETLVVDSGSRDIIASYWSSSYDEAGWRHRRIAAKMRYGGAGVYYFTNLFRKLWGKL